MSVNESLLEAIQIAERNIRRYQDEQNGRTHWDQCAEVHTGCSMESALRIALVEMKKAIERRSLRVLVCGRRDLDTNLVAERMQEVFDRNGWNPSGIIHGGAKGADAGAQRWAATKEVPVRVHPAQWDEHGRAAGPIRNQEMLDRGDIDVVLAFWDGKSRGTMDMVKRSANDGYRVYVEPCKMLGGAE